jgi:hypothetical protein
LTNAPSAKLKSHQRLEGHHFNAQLLHFPEPLSAKEARAAAAAASALASEKVSEGQPALRNTVGGEKFRAAVTLCGLAALPLA